MAKIGFIGLGIMGAPMAGHLRAAGHKLFVHTRGKVPPDDRRRPAPRPAPTREEVGASAPRSSSMVPDTPDVEAVLFGENGVADGPVARARSWST